MQITGRILRAIESVLQAGEAKPADLALREVLRSGGVSPDEKGLISRAVFTFYRWQGWVSRSTPLRGQLEHAFELAERFTDSPGSFGDAELLQRAVPAWLADAMELSPELVREFQKEPRLWLRARPGTARTLAAKLTRAEVHESIPDAVWYEGQEDLFRTPEFHQGEFEIQDLSSQVVGHVCAPRVGATWWDACAGEGGKTLHLCDLMDNKGLVWASDTARWRLDVLKRRAGRAKLFNYRIKPWAAGEQLPTKTKFEGVLVDAPCSGIGTWGRNPHARWTTSPTDVAELAAVQQKILGKVADSLKPGGKLVYSVCTLTRAETEDVANEFERSQPAFRKLKVSVPGRVGLPGARVTLRPEEWHATGMFIAAWERAG